MKTYARHTTLYSLLLLLAAAGCGKQHTTEIPRVPESGTVPIVWSVDMEKNGVASRSLIGSQTDMGDITIEQAEEIKLLRGTCLPERVNDWESVVPTPENGRRQRAYSRRLMATVLKARADEFLRHYRKLLEERGDLERVRTIVLTGGGANLAGLPERARDIFPGKTVRVGLPNNIDGAPQLINQPDASVVMGLIGEAADKVAGKGDRQLLNLSAPGFLQNLKNVLIGDY